MSEKLEDRNLLINGEKITIRGYLNIKPSKPSTVLLVMKLA